MASANPLEDEISCSICFEIFSNPHLLRECLHTFCHNCIKRLEQSGSVQCPECRVMTESRHIKKDFKTARLIDVYHNHAEMSKSILLNSKCGMCKKSNEVKSHCSECEHYMCANCEKIHNTMKLTKIHDVKQIKVMIKGYETVLRKNIDDLEKQMESVNLKSSHFIKGMEKVETDRAHQLSDVKAYTENAIKELQQNQTHLEQVINEANNNLIKNLTKGMEICDENKVEIQKKIDFINQMIRGQDINTLSESTSSVDKSIKEDIENITASLNKTEPLADATVSVEKGMNWDAKTCINIFINGAVHGHTLNKKCDKINIDLHKKKFYVDKNQKMKCTPFKLCLINEELWCAGVDALYVYSKECNPIKTVTHPNIKNVLGLTECHTGDIIVACSWNNGLHQLDSTGTYQKHIAEGAYSDVYHYKDSVYALEYNASKIIVFRYFGNRWSEVSNFTLHYDKASESDKIIVTETGIWISANNKHQIYCYNKDDGKLQSHISKLEKNNCYPKICNVDSNSQMLVANFGDFCLEFCDKAANWHVLIKQMKGRPMHAVIGENCMWVITFGDKKLLKFTMV